ncbi:MAG: hypothetical protein RAK21_07235 [Synechococcus sp. SP2 MAG]|jgi:hypothetical protein|nr:hypothetical protein [Synechococcus sp. SP2 MAG]
MKILIHKAQALVIVLTAGLAVISPATAGDQKTKDLINVEISEGASKISIKNIRNLGGKEFSYQNSDKNIILVKCNADKILVKYWYVPKIDSASPQEATSKMQWHRASPKSQAHQESKFLCDSNKNSRNQHLINHQAQDK